MAHITLPTGVPSSIDPLRGSMADFARPVGRDLMARTAGVVPYIAARVAADVWPYSRVIAGAPVTSVRGEVANGEIRRGLNFGAQDYLSLAAHPSVHEAAVRAIRDYGVHVASSAALQGRTDQTVLLEREIADTLGTEHTVLFPTGWGAAYGAVTALVREDDHVVIDRLAHASLQAGAHAATRNVVAFDHLDVASMRAALAAIRAVDAEHGILVVTEGLFSMDSDSPDLRAMQATCREFEATLLVDVAHDFGVLGPAAADTSGAAACSARSTSSWAPSPRPSPPTAGSSPRATPASRPSSPPSAARTCSRTACRRCRSRWYARPWLSRARPKAIDAGRR